MLLESVTQENKNSIYHLRTQAKNAAFCNSKKRSTWTVSKLQLSSNLCSLQLCSGENMCLIFFIHMRTKLLHPSKRVLFNDTFSLYDYIAQEILEWVYRIGEMKMMGRNQSTWRTAVPVPPCPPQVTHGLHSYKCLPSHVQDVHRHTHWYSWNIP